MGRSVRRSPQAITALSMLVKTWDRMASGVTAVITVLFWTDAT
jgi:hypothetical protein